MNKKTMFLGSLTIALAFLMPSVAAEGLQEDPTGVMGASSSGPLDDLTGPDPCPSNDLVVGTWCFVLEVMRMLDEDAEQIVENVTSLPGVDTLIWIVENCGDVPPPQECQGIDDILP